jgi:phage terminase large subunit-like protein
MKRQRKQPTSSHDSQQSSPALDWSRPDDFNGLPKYDAIATAGDAKWNGNAALHAVTFIQTMCRFTEGSWSGKQFILQKWQRDLIANLYGWIRPDGTRRYRKAHVLIPRKSGKTETAAAILLYSLLADDEPTPECVGIARDREQAKLCFKRAKRMVELEPQMSSMVEVFQNRLVSPAVHGVYKVLSSDAPGAHGLNVSACVADEIHSMENRRDLWDAVATSQGARKQPLMLSITTAGTLRESLEFDLFQYGQKVCEGVIQDPSFLPCMYYADEADDWQSPDTWRKANPSLGTTVSLDWYAAEAKRAVDQPSHETPFRTYFLCQHVSASSRWLRMSDWDECEREIDEASLAKIPCYLGIDLGQTQDLSSLAAVWVDGDRIVVKSWNFAPEVGAAIRARRDGVPYLQWQERGWLTLTPGDTTDYAFIVKQIEEIASRYKIRMIGYDPYNSQNLANDLEHKGMNVVRVPQSFLNLSTPTRMWERAVTGKTLEHDGNPALAFAMANTVVETDFAGNPRPSKRRSVERIDPLVAAIVALAASLHDEKIGASVYEKRGLTWL